MTLKEEKQKFAKVSKLIIKTKLSKNPDTLKTYRIKIIEAYNEFITYCRAKYNKVNTESKELILRENKELNTKLVTCLKLLNCEYQLPDKLLALLAESAVGPPSARDSTHSSSDEENNDKDEENTDSDEENIDTDEENDSDEHNNKTDEKHKELVKEDNKAEDVVTTLQENNLPNKHNIKMAEPTNIEFLRLCGETIPNHYSGDPLQLQAFINAIDLLETIATTPALVELLVRFIKTRLTASAIEKLIETDITIALIKNRLKISLKPENDKIIKGKMAALKADKNSLADFSKQAENLAESLKRALVLDGIPSQKANSMAIDETITMCKNSAKTDYVKSVLASTSYQNPKEVVAKFIVETGNDKSDKQILMYQAGKKPQYKRNNSYDTRHFSNYNNSRYTSSNDRSNGNRFKNNRSSYNQNRNYQRNDPNRQRSYQNSNNSTNRNVRYTNSGNSIAPQRQTGEIELVPQNQEN